MKSQLASLTFTPTYAALVAIINTKFPEIGELLLKRVISQVCALLNTSLSQAVCQADPHTVFVPTAASSCTWATLVCLLMGHASTWVYHTLYFCAKTEFVGLGRAVSPYHSALLYQYAASQDLPTPQEI